MVMMMGDEGDNDDDEDDDDDNDDDDDDDDALHQAEFLLSLEAQSQTAKSPTARKRWGLLSSFDRAKSSTDVTHEGSGPNFAALATQVRKHVEDDAVGGMTIQ
jgi:hypothetical protein